MWEISTDSPEKLGSSSLGTCESKSVSPKIACCIIFPGDIRRQPDKPISVNY